MDSKTENLKKLLLLMWKDFLLQYRHPFQVLLEILVPTAFSVLLVIIRYTDTPVEYTKTNFTEFDLLSYLRTNALNQNAHNDTSLTLLYTPNSPEVSSIMTCFKMFYNVIGFMDERQLMKYYMATVDQTIVGAIQFNSTSLKNKYIEIKIRIPTEWKGEGVKLEWHTDRVYPPFQSPGPRDFENNYGAYPRYYEEGFLTIQYITGFLVMNRDRAKDICGYLEKSQNHFLKSMFIKNPILDIVDVNITMKRFPYNKWKADSLLKSLMDLGSLLIMISFNMVCSNTVWSITDEKENKLKESMSIMGLPNYLHWVAWFLKSFIHLLISVGIIVFLLKITWHSDMAVLTHSSPVVILVFFLLYISSMITFSFAISVFFSNANIASTVCSTVWYLSYTPYVLMQENEDCIGIFWKLFSSLSLNTAMAYGFKLILKSEGTGEGVLWRNIFMKVRQECKDNLTLSMVLGMLLLDTVIYLLVALYIEAVLPGESGMAQPWYFPFTYKYWMGEYRHLRRSRVANIDTSFRHSTFFEFEPTNLYASVKIRGLTKKFKKKIVLNDLNLNLYEGEITVLIGHNGAGKTVTIDTLSGMIRPTKGTAYINGYDIRTNMDEIRKSLGVCLQHDVIFNELTVEEHLYFCSTLKGKRGEQLTLEINKYIEMMDLEPKRHSTAATLSGGFKRRLSVGMALCANSKVIMLDEPTAGMDPSGRRIIWDALQSEKEDRTILMVTHFMDEADLLGDRIAVIAEGQLQCYDTSYNLKKTYGGGYHLIMDKSEYCNADLVTALLQKHIPGIEVNGDIGSQLTYFLEEEYSAVFENLLRDLENKYEDLGIRSFGIRLTTMEDVFMKVGAKIDKRESYSGILEFVNRQLFIENIAEIGNRYTRRKSLYGQKKSIKKTGYRFLIFQVYSMIMKRILYLIRNWVIELLQILLPILFLVLAFATIKDEIQAGEPHKMLLTLDKFIDTQTLTEGQNQYFHSYGKLVQKIVVVEDIESYMIEIRTFQKIRSRKSYIIGAVFQNQAGRDKIIAYFNNDAFHSPAIALGYAINAISVVKAKQRLVFVNQPLPYRISSKVFSLATDSRPEFAIAFNVSYSLTIALSLYVLFYVRERGSKYKHLQIISGVKIYIFWSISFAIDLLNFIFTSIVLLITLSFYHQEGFSSFLDLCRLFFIFLSFGFGVLPMNYLVSHFTIEPPLGYTYISSYGTGTGTTAFTIIAVLKQLEWAKFSNNIHWFFMRFFPHYSLVISLKNNYKMYGFKKLCTEIEKICVDSGINEEKCKKIIRYNFYTRFCKVVNQHYFGWEEPGIGKNICQFFLSGILIFALLMLYEYNIFKKVYLRIRDKIYKHKQKEIKTELKITADIDDDVKEEKMKIYDNEPEDLFEEYTLLLKDVTKYYKKFLAVNSISVGVGKYECFGLLGTNGAGKTTVFKMLTGDLHMSSGDAWVSTFRLKTRFQEIQELIGYCPQHDALLDDLTPRETLIMFGLLRGFRYKTSKALTVKLSIDFDFYGILDRKVKEISRGSKRKLSAAIALIADPLVVYLDEPTTGMDVSTKRYLWNVLNTVREHGKCIIFTSHSMEECEALCTRIAIMVNGEFKCLGSSQHLKHKFAAGYSLIIKIKKQKEYEYMDVQEISDFIEENFEDVQLKERQGEVLTFYISNPELKLSDMFGVLEVAKNKENTKIEEYSLGQSSLEQVFLTFTQFQRPRFSKFIGRIAV